MSLTALADGARWVLVVLFVLAGLEKIVTLRAGAARWHPVILPRPWMPRYAIALLSLSLIADTSTIVLLMTWEALGASVAIVVITTYTVAGWPVHWRGQEQGCRCLWNFLEVSSRKGFVVRNLLIVLLAIAVAISRPALSLVGLVLGGATMASFGVAARAAGSRSGSSRLRPRERMTELPL